MCSTNGQTSLLQLINIWDSVFFKTKNMGWSGLWVDKKWVDVSAVSHQYQSFSHISDTRDLLHLFAE